MSIVWQREVPSGPGVVEDEPIFREMGSGQAVATEILEARKRKSVQVRGEIL